MEKGIPWEQKKIIWNIPTWKLCWASQSKFEKLHADILGVLAKQWIMSKLHSEKVSIIELDIVTNHSRMPRFNTESCFMMSMGKKTKYRDALEYDRRFCGNGTALQWAIIRISHAFDSSLIFLYSYSFCMLLGKIKHKWFGIIRVWKDGFGPGYARSWGE